MTTKERQIVLFTILLILITLGIVFGAKAQNPPSSLDGLDSVASSTWVPTLVRIDSVTGLGWAIYRLAGTLVEADVFFPIDSLSNGMPIYNAFYGDSVWVRTPFANSVPLRGPNPIPTGELPSDTLFGIPSHFWEAIRIQKLVGDSLKSRYPR